MHIYIHIYICVYIHTLYSPSPPLSPPQPSPLIPQAAWEVAVSRGEDILKVLGSKLRRCRGVFNRLCASPLIVDFLETYPLNVAGAADYYKVSVLYMYMYVYIYMYMYIFMYIYIKCGWCGRLL
jgi:hypothetical protein